MSRKVKPAAKRFITTEYLRSLFPDEKRLKLERWAAFLIARKVESRQDVARLINCDLLVVDLASHDTQVKLRDHFTNIIREEERRENELEGPAVAPTHYLSNKQFPLTCRNTQSFMKKGTEQKGAIFVKGAVEAQLCADVAKELEAAATTANSRAALNGGKKPKAGTFGFLDYLGNANTFKCRESTFTLDNKELLGRSSSIGKLVKKVWSVYEKYAPEQYTRQSQACPEYCSLFETGISTVAVNNTFRTSRHTDEKDFKYGFGIVMTLKGFWNGCNLAIEGLEAPQADDVGQRTVQRTAKENQVCFDIQPGDVLFFDTSLPHGNTEFLDQQGHNIDAAIRAPPKQDRLSIVLYFEPKLGEARCATILKDRTGASLRPRVDDRPKIARRARLLAPENVENIIQNTAKLFSRVDPKLSGLFYLVLDQVERTMSAVIPRCKPGEPKTLYRIWTKHDASKRISVLQTMDTKRRMIFWNDFEAKFVTCENPTWKYEGKPCVRSYWKPLAADDNEEDDGPDAEQQKRSTSSADADDKEDEEEEEEDGGDYSILDAVEHDMSTRPVRLGTRKWSRNDITKRIPQLEGITGNDRKQFFVNFEARFVVCKNPTWKIEGKPGERYYEKIEKLNSKSKGESTPTSAKRAKRTRDEEEKSKKELEDVVAVRLEGLLPGHDNERRK